jgi:hypothetical protein
MKLKNNYKFSEVHNFCICDYSLRKQKKCRYTADSRHLVPVMMTGLTSSPFGVKIL